MPDERPLLVIVGGAPASGKTTLAELLTRELRLPLLARDTLKECLMDSLGSPTRTRSIELGGASYALLYTVLDKLLEAGVGAILESNFSRGRSESELQGPVARTRAVQIHCHVSSPLARTRYIARAECEQRHPGHHDSAAETLANLDQALAEGRHEPLDLEIPLLTVDTTDGYVPDFPTILEFIASRRPNRALHHTPTGQAPIT